MTTFLQSPSKFIAIATSIGALIVFVMPTPEGVAPSAQQGAALCLLAIGLFATSAIPEFVTSLLFFALAMIIGISQADVVFSGLHSGAFWLVLGGLIIGVAVQKTGLGARLASAIAGRFSSSYPTLVFGILLVGIALAFVMPSTMGRVILLAPIVIALADGLGYEKGTTERTGLVLAMVCGTWMPSSAILPANVPNMVLSGVAENLFGMTFTYGEYMLVHMPVNGLLKALVIYVLIMVLFPSSKGNPRPSVAPETGELSADARKLAVILVLTLSVWATDFIHHVSPAWVALAAALACLWPGFGVVDAEDLKSKVNFPSVVYVGAVLSLGAVLVDTGAGDWLGGWLLDHVRLSPEAPLESFYSMVGLGALINMAATAPGAPAVVGPLAMEMSSLSGMPLKTVMMSQVIAYSTVVLPYQVPPIIVAMHIAEVPMRDGAKTLLILAAISFVLLVPLNFLWWSWLGMI